MHILYKITYLPHLGTDKPKYYIGSKYNWKGKYLGSVASKQIFDYTEGLPLRSWWTQQKKSSHLFSFEVLENFTDVTPVQLVEEEKRLQLSLNVLGPDYFNQAIAAKGFASGPKTKETRAQMSVSMSNFWQTEEGKAKRARLSDRNRNTKPLRYIIETPLKEIIEVVNLKQFAVDNNLPRAFRGNIVQNFKSHPARRCHGYRLISKSSVLSRNPL